ncbi:MAG: Flp pilus assembly protein CpaB [Planctomycetota bacterium]|jgi:pilus assembly protein CpaB
MNNKLAVVVAVILGVVAALAVRSYLASEKQRHEKQYLKMQIMVANKKIKKGQPLKLTFGENGMVKHALFPQRMIKSGMITPAEARRYRDYIPLRDIEAGAPLFRQDLQAPIEHSDSAESVVADGMRAVTIPVDMISGVAGLVRTGDRVDVIATFNLTGQGREKRVATSYLLQNVRVVALDNKTARSVRSDRKSNRVYRAVTLELKPEDSLRLINAQEQGSIRLLLRHRSDVTLEPEERNGKPIVVDVPSHELDSAVPHIQSGSGKKGMMRRNGSR